MIPLVMVTGHGRVITAWFDDIEQAKQYGKSWLIGAAAATGLGYAPYEPRLILPTVHPEQLEGLPDALRRRIEAAVQEV
jgi:hypothetical protein